MLISKQSFKPLGYFLACLVFTPLVSTAFADAPTSSIKMPRASKSLLLDIEQVGGKIIAVGERGHILLSEDQGGTWIQADVPTAQMLNAVTFANEQNGWAVGHDGNILHTTDGGETWSLQRNGLEAQKEMNIAAIGLAKAHIQELEAEIEIANSSSVVEPVVEGEEPAMSLDEQMEEARYQLENAQEKQKSPAIAAPLMDVWFSDLSNGWAVGAFGILLETTNGGKTWLDRSHDIRNTDNYHLNAIVGMGDSIYIAGEAGLMIYSNDKGQTWNKSNLGYDGTIFGIFAPKDGSYIVATGLRGNTFRSTDGAITWEKLSPNVSYSLTSGSVIGSSYMVLVGAGGSIAVSEDKGMHFKHYTLPARASLSSVLALEKGHFLMVGQGGVYSYTIQSVEK